MIRTLARLRPLWSVVLVVSLLLIPLMLVGLVPPGWASGAAAVIVVTALLLGVAPRTPQHRSFSMVAPVHGSWLAVNSPGQRLPSHGARALGQYAAIDLIRAGTSDTARMLRPGWRGTPPEEFSTFGAGIHAMAAGRVIRAHSRAPDHRARNTRPALLFMTTVEAFLRSLGGARALYGNHVIVAQEGGSFAVYAHLRQDSVTVECGDRVVVGQQLAEAGNSGNSSLPHLHVHLMDRADPNAAAGLTMVWDNVACSGEIDGHLAGIAKPPSGNALAAMPRNGEVFLVRGADG